MVARRSRVAALAAVLVCAVTLALAALVAAPVPAHAATPTYTDQQSGQILLLGDVETSGSGWTCTGYATRRTLNITDCDFTNTDSPSDTYVVVGLSSMNIGSNGIYRNPGYSRLSFTGYLNVNGTVESGFFTVDPSVGSTQFNGATINGGVFQGDVTFVESTAVAAASTINGGLFEDSVSLPSGSTITGGIFLDSVSVGGSTLSTLSGTAKFGTAYGLTLESNSSATQTSTPSGNYLNHTDSDLRAYLNTVNKGVAYKGSDENRYQYIPDSSRTLVGLYLLQSGATKPTSSFSISNDFTATLGGVYYEFTMPSYDCVVYAVYSSTDAEAPAITTQPSGASYTAGATATALSVVASVSDGGTLSYQWYSNATDSTTGGTAISGATRASYTPPTSAAGTTYYYCVVTNTNNAATNTTTASTTSNTAKIEVAKPQDSTTMTVTQADYTYGETAPAYALSGVSGGSASSVRYTGTTNAGASYDSASAPTDAGSYSVTVTYETSTTVYAASDSFTVKRAANAISGLACANVTYGSTPSPSATAAYGTPTYTYAESASGSFGAWSTTNAVGTYYVKASVAQSANYEAAEAAASFTVGKATPALSNVSAADINLSDAATNTLFDVEVSGMATVGGTQIAGTWSWKNTSTALAIGQNSATAVFTPTDTDNINSAEQSVTFNVTFDLDFTDATSDEGDLEAYGYAWDNSTKTLTFSTKFNSVDASAMGVKLPAGAKVVLNAGATVTVQNVLLSGDTTTISGAGELTVKEDVKPATDGTSFSLTVDGSTLIVEGEINNGNTGTTGNALVLENGANVEAGSVSWTGAEGVSLSGASTLTAGTSEYGQLFVQKLTLDEASVVNAKGSVRGYSSADFSGIYDPSNATSPVNYLPDGYSVKDEAGSDKVVLDASGQTAEDFVIKFRLMNAVSVSCADIVYGDTPAPSATATYGASGEPTFTYSTSENGTYGVWDSSWGAGTYYVKASVAAGSTTDNGKTIEYHSASAVASFKVTGKSIEGAIVTLGDALTYNGTAQTQTVTSVTLDGVDITDSVTISGNTATNAGDYTLTVTAKADGNYAGSVTKSFSVAKAKLTATYAGETITYGETPALAVNVTGFVNDETASTAAGYTAPTVAASSTDAGSHVLMPSGGAADNYSFHYESGTLTINKATASIEWPSAEAITYGEPLSESALSGGSTDLGTFTWTEPSAILEAGSQTASITFTPDAQMAKNYTNLTAQTGSVAVTVNKETPAVTLAEDSITGSGNTRTVTLSATVSGLTGDGLKAPSGNVTFTAVKKGETDAVSIGIAAIDATTSKAIVTWSSAEHDAEYTVTASYAGDANYSTASQTLAVNTARTPQSIAIQNPGTKTYGDEAFTLALSNAGDGAGAVTWESSDPSVLAVDATGKATIKGHGEVTITAKKAADDDYNEAEASIKIEVGKRTITITADSKTAKQGDAMPELTYSVGGSGLATGDSFSAEPALSCHAGTTDEAGDFEIAVSGGTIQNADDEDVTGCYSISYAPGTLTVERDTTLYTVEIPVTVKVVQGGEATPPVESFAIQAAFDTEIPDEWADELAGQYSVSVEGSPVATNGVGDYATATVKVSFTRDAYRYYINDAWVRITQAAGSTDGWAYDDYEYSAYIEQAEDGSFYVSYLEVSSETQPVPTDGSAESVVFTNIYTKDVEPEPTPTPSDPADSMDSSDNGGTNANGTSNSTDKAASTSTSVTKLAETGDTTVPFAATAFACALAALAAVGCAIRMSKVN